MVRLAVLTPRVISLPLIVTTARPEALCRRNEGSFAMSNSFLPGTFYRCLTGIVPKKVIGKEALWLRARYRFDKRFACLNYRAGDRARTDDMQLGKLDF